MRYRIPLELLRLFDLYLYHLTAARLRPNTSSARESARVVSCSLWLPHPTTLNHPQPTHVLHGPCMHRHIEGCSRLPESRRFRGRVGAEEASRGEGARGQPGGRGAGW